MGNLNCKTCQCNRQTEDNEEVMQPETIFNIFDHQEDRKNTGDSRQNLVEDAKNELKSNVNLIYNFKSEPNWDLIFNPEDNKSATINGLYSLKKKLIDTYESFFAFNGIPESIVYQKQDLESISNSNDFNNKFKQFILKNVLIHFKYHGLDKKLKNSSINLSNDENLDQYNLLFNAPRRESFLNQGKLTLHEGRKSIQSIKPLEIIYENKNQIERLTDRRSSVYTTKANTKDSSNTKGGIVNTVTDFLKNFAVSRKQSFNEKEEKKEENINVINLNELHEQLEDKKANRVLIKTKDYYELNKIQELYHKEEENLIFVSFRDKVNNLFYEGYWHIMKNCKYGLGVEYNFENNNRYKYFGYFKDNRFHGLGILLKEHNYSYYGEFRNGKFAGFGFEKGKTFSYQGFFKDNKYSGYGEYCFMKSSYTGSFAKGQKMGIGFAKFEDNCSYIGMYQDNLMHGLGLYKWPEGHMYYGGWKEDKKYGIGYHFWNSGHSYLGGYKSDLKDGNGEYIFENGAKLRGSWTNGKKENIFELIDLNQNVYQIVYRNDIQIE
jgi:hypothetical protein